MTGRRLYRLRRSALRVQPVERRAPTYNSAVQVVSSAPTRIDLAGGTLDIWPLYLFHEGAVTVNTAISLRAHASIESRADGRVELISLDTGRRAGSGGWASFDGTSELPLLSLLARHYRIENATVTTRSDSPAGAGIAGSSALALAVCSAMARWSKQSDDAVELLRVAMNVECQTIRVPTGAQDYRPALYGGTAAIELRVEGVRRVAIDVDPRELERRLVLAFTGAPRNSGTNNWDITKRHLDGDRDIFDAFERIRDTAAAMRTALEQAAWDEVGRQIVTEWENRKRLAPGVSTPAIDHLIDLARHAGATAAKVCGAGGGGCLFCYGPPAARPAIAAALAAGGARVLDFRLEMEGLRVG
jgi:D-glycero-alpha-D-manno-heptose-7-phosphate kinase